MHNTDTLMDNMDIVSNAKRVTNLFYFTLLTIYTLVQVLQKPQTNQIYHPVNRLRSFLLLAHSVTRSHSHSVTIFNVAN